MASRGRNICVINVFISLIYDISIPDSKVTNIAFRKPAYQSSAYLHKRKYLVEPGRAVDGICENVFSAGSCSHTNEEMESTAWWEVDLLSPFRIGDVRMLNRAKCIERLHDVTVNVYEDKMRPRKRKHCVTRRGLAGPGWLNLSCEFPVTGRYVRIVKPKTHIQDVLTLCEVEIYEAPDSKVTNIAFRKPAYQSSAYLHKRKYLVEPGRAVDGICENVFSAGSCSHTNEEMESTAWWEVDLLSPFRIGDVRMLNRAKCIERLHDVTVNVYEDKMRPRKRKHCVTRRGLAGPGWLNLSCEFPVTGRYVRIVKPKTHIQDVLTLCEVEIYEAPETMKPKPHILNAIPTTVSTLRKLGDVGLSYLNCCSICG